MARKLSHCMDSHFDFMRTHTRVKALKVPVRSPRAQDGQIDICVVINLLGWPIATAPEVIPAVGMRFPLHRHNLEQPDFTENSRSCLVDLDK